MNPISLAIALREQADRIQIQEPRRPDDFDAAELLRVLARVVEGKTIAKAFGAPGDWGYSHPIGKALAQKALAIFPPSPPVDGKYPEHKPSAEVIS